MKAIRNIKRWASMQRTTYHKVGIFNISFTRPDNYVGWSLIVAEVFVWALFLLIVKYFA